MKRADPTGYGQVNGLLTMFGTRCGMKHVSPCALAVLAMLVACGAPHPLSKLDKRGTAEVAGFSFRVNYNDTRAEVTRTNRVWRPDRGDLREAALIATAQVTGCAPRVATLEGDMALMKVKLTCKGAKPKSGGQICEGIGSVFDADTGVIDLEFDCRS